MGHLQEKYITYIDVIQSMEIQLNKSVHAVVSDLIYL